MGSSISAIYDKHETYVAFCELLNEPFVSVRESFFEHEKELMKKHKYVKDGCWYKKFNN